MARGPLRIASGVVLRPPVPRPPVGSLDFALQAYPYGREGFVDAARWATHLDARVERIVGTWDTLGPRRRARTWLEDLCREVGIDPGEFLGLVTRVLYDLNRSISGILTAEALPEVTQAGIDRACTPRGFADRRMFLRPLFDPTCRPFASKAGSREATPPVPEKAPAAPGDASGLPEDPFLDTIRTDALRQAKTGSTRPTPVTVDDPDLEF